MSLTSLNKVFILQISILLISVSISLPSYSADTPNNNSIEPGLVIITNNSVNSEIIDQKMLRAMFSKQIQQWPDGQAVKVFVLSAEQHEQFCESYLGILPYVLERYWSRLAFSGRGTKPETVDSLDEMLDLVAQTPGAIGYIPEDLINERVSILRTQ